MDQGSLIGSHVALTYDEGSVARSPVESCKVSGRRSGSALGGSLPTQSRLLAMRTESTGKT
jgi:hypothetical protein